MRIRFNLLVFCISFAFYLCISDINAQILKDTSSISILKKTVDLIYDFQFEDAKVACDQVSVLYPGHPVVNLLNGMIKYWANYPILPSSPVRVEYENDLSTCIRLCEKKHDQVDEPEYLLINLCARGLLLLFYSDNDLNSEVFPIATSTYPYIRDSFKVTSSYADFYFFTGLYNYYREAYPEAHPIYKALTFLFPKGDMVKGLQELNLASQNSIFLKAESYSFLSWIFTNYENDIQQATKYSKSLHKLYPENIQYKSVYIKNLLLLKYYDEAEKSVRLLSPEKRNSYYLAQQTIFNGILQEKKYNNRDLARQFYEKGLKEISAFGDYGKDYAAYAYFGLSRIINEGDKKKNTYRKMALELADFKRDDFSE